MTKPSPLRFTGGKSMTYYFGKPQVVTFNSPCVLPPNPTLCELSSKADNPCTPNCID